MVVLRCPDCHGHSEGVIDINGEVIFSCDFCHYVGFFLTMPEQNYGKTLLVHCLKEGNTFDYAMMTTRVQDGKATYFVLANTEVLHEGASMSEAAGVYANRAAKMVVSA